jgi:hypothetical protein
MSGDYFSPDGGHKGETPTKPCDTCRGKGWVYRQTWVNLGPFELPIHIPIYRECPVCDGCGVIDMDETEIWLEEQARKDDEADFNNDN